jgi:cytochrome c-type biogenesis protein
MVPSISLAEKQILRSNNRRMAIFLHALLFVLGFSLVFIVGWGGATTLLGSLFSTYKPIIAKAGGIVVILFGLSTLGVLKMPWLAMDTRPQWEGKGRKGFFASGLMGMFFAAGWTPCIGTTLGAILTLSLTQKTASQGMLLSGAYAFGLGMPFLLVGLFIDRALTGLKRFRRYVRPLQIASGLLLIVIGLMILTNQVTMIAIWAQRNRFFLDFRLGQASAPTFAIAVLAGLLSFFSPCVLPLVPAYMGYLSGHAVRNN